MKKFFYIFALLLMCCATGMAQDITGYWKGDLAVGNDTLSLYIDIAKTGNGGYTCKLDIPQQNVEGMPTDTVAVDGMSVAFGINKIGFEYNGMLVMNSILGNFSQNGIKLPLNFSKAERAVAKRPQEPKGPFPYRCEEVSFSNARDGITLYGTLTLPEGKGPFPAVVLITGSGTENRNEEVMGHKPFLVIADYYTRRGIAVLRFDDRGCDSATVKAASKATSFDLSYDAEAGVDYLMGRPEIDHGKIGVAGHSEGGMISFMIAARRPDIAFVVSFAGPSVTGEEILKSQRLAIAEVQGAPQEYLDAMKKSDGKMFDLIAGADSVTPELDEELVSMQTAGGTPEKTAKEMAGQLTSPWMFYFLKHDPASDITATKCPVLCLDGSKDKQVIASINIPEYEKIAQENGKTNMTIKEIPGLNHLFQHCATGNPNEYYSIEETFSPGILELSADWILSAVK